MVTVTGADSLIEVGRCENRGYNNWVLGTRRNGMWERKLL